MEENNGLVIKNGQAFIGTRLIAFNTDKRHADVLEQIERIFYSSDKLVQLENKGYQVIKSEYKTENNRTTKEYLLNRKAFTYYCFYIHGFDDFKTAYIDRFDEMEEKLKQPMSTNQLIAQALIAAHEIIAQTEKERDEAIATKAWISDKKTATAMNTASQKSKENARLKIQLDASNEMATIKRVEKATNKKYRWEPLKNYCKNKEAYRAKVPDSNYGTVWAYPKEAWLEVYGIDLTTLFE